MARNTDITEDVAFETVALDDPDFLRHLVERALQRFLEAEMTAHLGAARYERGEGRRGHRNGYKPRQLHTRVGTLTLRVPRDGEGTFSTELFARYQRSERALVLALMEMYVEGVSTRKVAEVTEALCGTSFSKSQVSDLVSRLDTDLHAWRERPLTAEGYPYLFVDARYEHVRVDGQVVSQGVLIVSAIRDDGRREIVAVDVADTESEATYHDLFRRLKQRGLAGVRLVTSDDHAGLRQIFTAATREQALASTWQLADEWRSSHPEVARALEEGVERCLACLAFPLAHQPRLRTTNGLERFNQELKRRTRVVRIFPNRASCLRPVSALCMEQSEEWASGRIYLPIGQLVESPEAGAERGPPLSGGS